MAVSLFSVDDGELLVGAALLHDIGYAPDLARTGFQSNTIKYSLRMYRSSAQIARIWSTRRV